MVPFFNDGRLPRIDLMDCAIQQKAASYQLLKLQALRSAGARKVGMSTGNIPHFSV
jgi:hypothetical protein